MLRDVLLRISFIPCSLVFLCAGCPHTLVLLPAMLFCHPHGAHATVVPGCLCFAACLGHAAGPCRTASSLSGWFASVILLAPPPPPPLSVYFDNIFGLPIALWCYCCPDILICRPSSLLSSYPAIVVLPYPRHSSGANNCLLRCAGWPLMHGCLCCVVINTKHFARCLTCINWHVLVSTRSMGSLQPYCYCMLPLLNP